MDTANDLITATISEFRRISGIGRSRIYELLDDGEIESVHIGYRRLILLDSYRRLLDRQRGKQPATTRSLPRSNDRPSA
jgi:hypothetical protein